MVLGGAHDLVILVPLAGDQQHVARLQCLDRRGDGRLAVADLPRARRRGEDFGADRGGVLGARIVVGDDRLVGQLAGDGAHLRTLALVAVAAAAEDHDEPVLRIGTQRLQRRPQRIGGVGIVHEHRRAIMLGHEFQPPLGALELAQRGEGIALLHPARHGQRRRDQRVAHLELPGQRQMEAELFPDMAHFDALPVTLIGNGQYLDIGALAAHGEQRRPGAERGEHEGLVLGIVDIDHRRAAIDQEVREQPQLGVAVFFHVLVIVEMVAAEIGEGHRLEMDAVHPPLVEPVAGGFQRHMVDALGLERPHRLMQRAGIGGGEAPLDQPRRRLHPQRADAGAGNTGMLPDLAHEGGDRRLAIGARDPDGDFRLRLEDARSGARIGGPHILDDDHRHARIAHRGDVADHGQRPAPHRVGHELVAMHIGAGQREEDVARLDPAAVRIEPEDRAQSLLRPGARAFEQLCDAE